MISPLLLVAAATQGQPAPVSRWVLQADPSLCALERQSPSQRATLSIATLPGSDAYRVVIVTGTATPGRSYEPTYMSFGTADRVLSRGSASATPDGSSMLTMKGLPADVLDRLAGASVAAVGFVDGAEATIDVAGSAKAVDAMRRCEASQLTEWGADPLQFAPGGRRMTALKQRDDWLSNATIMRIAALSQQADVDATYRVSVADTGRVDGCVPLSAAVEPKITKAVCGEVLKQQLFNPGMGPDGVATRGIATLRVVVSKQPT